MAVCEWKHRPIVCSGRFHFVYTELRYTLFEPLKVYTRLSCIWNFQFQYIASTLSIEVFLLLIPKMQSIPMVNVYV